MRNLFSLIALSLSAGMTYAGDPIAEVERLFAGRTAWVQEADGAEGGILLRMMNLELDRDSDRSEFKILVAAAQQTIPVRELHLTHSGDRAFGEGGLSFLTELPNLRLLSLGGCNYEARDLSYLAQCPNLERLYVSGKLDKVAWEGIATAKKLELIRAQYLRTDWESFPALPALRLLDAESSDLNDKGAAAIAKCPELICVYAYSTRLSNAGLMELAKAKKLQFLGVSSSTIDEAGAKAFRTARPDVELLTEKPEPKRAAPGPAGPGPAGPLALLTR